MRKLIVLFLTLALGGCVGLPTLESTPIAGKSSEVTSSPISLTTPPTALLPIATATIVQITGNVYVRDDQGRVIGWLSKGDQVQAQCSGSRCRISSGSYSRYVFWRGCSSENPDRKSCQAK